MSGDNFHPIAWLAWLAAAALPALSTRNPLYLSLTLLATVVTYVALGRRSPLARSWGAFVRFSAVLWLFTIPFTALTAHYGTLVLFRLPTHWPVIGGPITGEALLYGLTGGLALISLLLTFATFNVAVDQARVLRMTPGFVYQIGLVASIAVAFVPQTVATWQAIREAQQVRSRRPPMGGEHPLRASGHLAAGHLPRAPGVRDLLPLIMPLLVTSLERAVQLAESMEARGFGGPVLQASPRRRMFEQLAMLLGIGAVGAGLAASGFWRDRPLLAGTLLAGGTAALVWTFWDQGRRVRRSRYQRWQWGPRDRAVLVISLLAAASWIIAWLTQRSGLYGLGDWLFYYPYPPYSPWPAFQPLLGLALLALAVPGLLMPVDSVR